MCQKKDQVTISIRMHSSTSLKMRTRESGRSSSETHLRATILPFVQVPAGVSYGEIDGGGTVRLRRVRVSCRRSFFLVNSWDVRCCRYWSLLKFRDMILYDTVTSDRAVGRTVVGWKQWGSWGKAAAAQDLDNFSRDNIPPAETGEGLDFEL